MNKINVTIGQGRSVNIDLGGDLDNGCCGCEASALFQELKNLGIILSLKKVHCRLSIPERIEAKLKGFCKWEVANFLKQDATFETKRRAE